MKLLTPSFFPSVLAIPLHYCTEPFANDGTVPTTLLGEPFLHCSAERGWV
jgi:hypothetical protein